MSLYCPHPSDTNSALMLARFAMLSSKRLGQLQVVSEVPVAQGVRQGTSVQIQVDFLSVDAFGRVTTRAAASAWFQPPKYFLAAQINVLCSLCTRL